MSLNDLIFVSAQPDVPYFHWQTEIYIHNFIEKGINPNQIHVLFLITDGGKPTLESLELKKYNVNIHHYIDERMDKEYIPSLRPFMLSKWLKENPQFGKVYFYHDSDIIFRVLPDFESMINDGVCYLSDTKSYIGYRYINDCGERYEQEHKVLSKGKLLSLMSGVVGIDVEVIKEKQEESGGAQYLLKNVDYKFWDKVYRNCQDLYRVMNHFQSSYPILHGIQMWTSDMWSVLWNLWLFGKETEVTDKLSFSWATDNITRYDSKIILHMAGVTPDIKGEKFYKGDFITISPLDMLRDDNEHFDYIDSDSASKKYVEVMLSVIKNDI